MRISNDSAMLLSCVCSATISSVDMAVRAMLAETELRRVVRWDS